MKENREKMKFSEISLLDIFNFFIALASFVVAVIALINSKQIEMDVADYEFTLSQTPKVCILNQEFQIPFEFGDYGDKNELGSYKGAVNFDYVSDQDIPIRIPLCNVGIGLAQNCKVEFTALNQKKVALGCRELLKSYELDTYIGHDEKNPDICYETYLKNYVFKFDGSNLVYFECFNAKSIGEHYTYLDEDYISVYPYILPLSEEKEVSYFEISEELSAFIIEAIHQEILSTDDSLLEPITLELYVSFQDLEGNEYSLTYLLKFSAANSYFSILDPMIRIQLYVEEI